MAQNVTIAGAAFSAVPAIEIPKTGGGIATFSDPSVTTAVAADVAQGKLFLDSSGVLTQGTASGGGGSSYALIGSAEFTVSTTSTSQSKVDDMSTPGVFTAGKIVYVRVRDKAGKRSGYFYGSDVWFIHNGSSTSTTNKVGFTIRCDSNGILQPYPSAGYGVYPYQIYKTGTTRIYRRYNSSYSLTINGTYKVEVYLLDWPGNVSPFA